MKLTRSPDYTSGYPRPSVVFRGSPPSYWVNAVVAITTRLRLDDRRATSCDSCSTLEVEQFDARSRTLVESQSRRNCNCCV